MKKVYTVFIIENIEICIPSNDYYARGTDFYKEEKCILTETDSFITEQEAIESLTPDNSFGRRFTILPIYQ